MPDRVGPQLKLLSLHATRCSVQASLAIADPVTLRPATPKPETLPLFSANQHSQVSLIVDPCPVPLRPVTSILRSSLFFYAQQTCRSA